jgi:hypothetical protein
MSTLCILNDREAETMSGGWWRYSSSKRAFTSVQQRNTSANLALALGGTANATSFQSNLSGISTVIR